MTIEDEDQHWRWTVPGAEAVFTSREGGVSAAPWDSLNIGAHVGDDPGTVLENRRRAAALVALEPSRVAGVSQVHGADVWLDLARRDELDKGVRWDTVGVGNAPIEADALVTTRADSAIAVGVADCLPIAVAWGGAIAAIHAGWRSLEAGVIEQAMRVLRRAAGNAVATTMPRAVIGPALGVCCMEVGEEVAALFDASVIVRGAGSERERGSGSGSARPHLDARADAVRRLAEAGCELVEHVQVCTRCDARCFSHRGDVGMTGRQAMIVRRTEQ